MAPPSPAQPRAGKRPRRGGRLRRYSRRTFKGFGGLLAFFALALVAFFASLDTSFMRARIRALVKLPIDWKHTQLSLSSGLVLRGFSIANEPPFDAIAPRFLEIDRVEVSWSLAKLIGGKALAERVAISGAHFAIVIDEEGRTSLSALRSPTPAPGPTPPEAPTPLSRALEALGQRLPIERATIRDARLRLVQLTATGPRELVALIDAEATLPDPNEAAAKLEVQLLGQQLIPELPPIARLLSLETHASFRPGEHRVLVEVTQLRGLDGALEGEARLELPDEGAPLIARARLTLDSTPIQTVLDHRKSPLQTSGKLTLRADRLRLGALPSVEPGGQVEVNARLDRLALHPEGGLRLDGDHLELALTLHAPAPQAAPLPAPLPDAARSTAQLDLKIGHLALHRGGFDLSLAGLALETSIEGLDPYGKQLMTLARALRARGKLARLEVRPGTLEVLAEAIALDADLTLPGAAPGSLTLDAPIRSLAVTIGDRPILQDEPGHLHLALTDARFDPADPLAAEGKERSEITAGPLTLRSRLEKTPADAVAFDLDARARHLQPLSALISLPGKLSVPWREIAAHLHTKGRIAGLRRLGSIELDQQTELELDRPALRGGDLPVAARRLALALGSRGSLLRHRAELKLTSDQLAIAGEAIGAPTARVTMTLDRTRPRASATLALSGGAAPTVELSTTLDFSRAARVLACDLKLRASDLGLMSRLLPRSITQRHQLDWRKLAVELDGKLAARGAVTGFDELTPRLVRDPLEAARGEGSFKLAVRGLDYLDRVDPRALTLGGFTIGAELRATDGDAADRRPLRHAQLTVGLDHGRVSLGDHAILVTKIEPVLALDARGPARTPEVVAALDVTLERLIQDYYAAYPIGGLSLGTTLRADTRGLLRVERFALHNQAGGSKIALKGGLDLAAPLRKAGVAADQLLAELQAKQDESATNRLPGRVGIDVELELAQELGSFPLADDIRARGLVTLPLRVQSADLALFTLRGLLGLSGVSLTLGSRFEAKGVQGLIPLGVEVMLERQRRSDGTTGMRLRPVPHPEGVSFPRTHYTEHQPFLAQRSFFSADEVKLGDFRAGPLAGNLSIDHTRVELSQLEMHAAGGRVRGQLTADLAGEDTRLAFRGDVTGIMPTQAKGRDDRLDANLALVLEPLRLSIEGRAELVHISRALLLDLLDVWDPYHAEVNANRARLALKLGYPKQVRLGFAQGFASLKLELGGLASFVRVDEIKGVPVGPLLERYLGKALRPFLTAQTAPTAVPKEPSP